MITSALAHTTQDSGFSVGTLLLFVGGAILLAFFCSIGIIARIRENRLAERKETAAKAKSALEVTETLPETHGERDDQRTAGQEDAHDKAM